MGLTFAVITVQAATVKVDNRHMTPEYPTTPFPGPKPAIILTPAKKCKPSEKHDAYGICRPLA